MVCVPYVVTLLNWTPIFEKNTVKKEHQTDISMLRRDWTMHSNVIQSSPNQCNGHKCLELEVPTIGPPQYKALKSAPSRK